MPIAASEKAAYVFGVQAGEERDTLTEEYLRQEALGAFAHEVRTPLTAIRMVLELGGTNNGQLVLDEELATMLRNSVDQLQQLADDLQETSRLERGKARLAAGPCRLSAAIEMARAELGERVVLDGDVPEITAPWDEKRLAGAIRAMAEAAGRTGDGTGRVTLGVSEAEKRVRISISSGEPGQDAKPLASDVGFGFFAARQVVLAMGGDVEFERGERYFQVRLTLPLER